MYADESPIPVLDLGRTVKNAVGKLDMLPWQYNTIGVSDAIAMGNEGVCSACQAIRLQSQWC